MFTKKYVGPVDCASCEKGIVNLHGRQAEKVHWNRLPFREPGERIARVSDWCLSNIFNSVWQGVQLILGPSCTVRATYEDHHREARLGARKN